MRWEGRGSFPPPTYSFFSECPALCHGFLQKFNLKKIWNIATSTTLSYSHQNPWHSDSAKFRTETPKNPKDRLTTCQLLSKFINLLPRAKIGDIELNILGHVINVWRNNTVWSDLKKTLWSSASASTDAMDKILRNISLENFKQAKWSPSKFELPIYTPEPRPSTLPPNPGSNTELC